MAETVAPNRFERRRERNRAALLEAAIALFQEKGIRATRLEEICARADVAPRTFFNHFETREHLYRAIGEQRAHQLAAQIEARSDAPGGVAERLLGLFVPMGRYLEARPAYRELVSEMLNLRLETGNELVRTASLGRAARRFVEVGVARGDVGRRHPPEVLADLMLGVLTAALANWCAAVEDFDLPEALGQAARALADLFDASRDPSPTP